MKDVLFLILARSGSKGVPNKNILPIDGIPLIGYRILTALQSKLSFDLIVSTDSLEYAKIANSFGARTPFLRPSELASDNAKSTDACLHAIDWLEKNENGKWKNICLLEPTGPFTKINWIEEAIFKLNSQNASSIVACKYTSPHPLFIQDNSEILEIVSNNILNMNNSNRQNLKLQITPSGNFYISNIEHFKKSQSFYNKDTLSFVIPEPYSLEIDTPRDLEWANFLIEKGIIKKSELGIN